MSRFEVKNTKKLEELLIEVGEKYKLELINITPNFLGGNNPYCANVILRTLNQNNFPILYTTCTPHEDILYVKVFLKLNTEIGELSKPIYSFLFSYDDVGEIYE